MAGHSKRRSSAQKAESRNPAKAKRRVSTSSRRRKRPSAADLEAQLKHRIDELALENSRLRAELRQRSDDLSESLLQQAATSEVLQVISSSISDVEPVVEKLLEDATRVCGAEFGIMGLFDGEAYRRVALYNVPPTFDAIAPKEFRLDDNGPLGTVRRTGQVFKIDDFGKSQLYLSGFPPVVAMVDVAGVRTLVIVPMLRGAKPIGAISIYRKEVRPFSDRQIDLLKNFASQAVIAMENARLITETREALDRQTATAELLQVINLSPGNLAPVFEAMLDKALGLCDAAFGILWTYDGERLHAAAVRGVAHAHAEFLTRDPHSVGRDNAHARLRRGEAVVHIADVADDEAYRSGDPIRRNLVEEGGGRTLLAVPLRKDKAFLGDFVIYRTEVKPFSDKQIALLENFAAQAVIAMENARLLTETREALERQTATAEVLHVINSSPGDLAPVFETILEKAHSLCAVAQGALFLYDGEKFRAVAVRGLPEAFAAGLRRGFVPGPNLPHYRLLEGARFGRVPDWAEIDSPTARAALDAGIRTTLLIPLRREGKLLGCIGASRPEVRPFSEKEIALLESFAAQAVIAMENARLLDEVRHRNDELAEALEFQTATGEVLRIVASSPDHLQPVFDAMLEKAIALCDAKFGTLFLYDGKAFTVAADRNLPPAHAQVVRGQSFSPEVNSGFRRLVESLAPLHIRDLLADPTYAEREPLRTAAIELGGVRSLLAVPLLRKGELIGNFSIYRGEPGGFAENQIALVTTFADQAVIAIENARLLTKTREALDRQTATAEVLQVINSSRGDLAPVFDLMLQKALSLCGAAFGQLVTFDGVVFRAAAWRGYEPGPGATAPLPGMALHHLVHGEQIVHIPDITADDVYRSGNPVRRRLADEYGGRTAIWVALRKDKELLGAFVIYRTEVRPFSDKQIALLQGFAAQAVIAIENTRLLKETQEALERQTATAELLEVINSSPGDLAPVFDAMLEKATRLCGSKFGILWVYDGKRFTGAATHAVPAALAEFVREPVPVAASASLVDIVRGQNLVHVADLAATELYHAGNRGRRAYVDLGGARTLISVALRKDNALLGAFNVYRQEVRPFSDKEIALVQNFAAQAVIAMENARLLTETREALERQTATAEVLQVINSSPGDLAPVFEIILEKAHSLCAVAQGALLLYDGEKFRAVAVRGLSEALAERLRQGFIPGPNHPSQRLMEGARFDQVSDWAEIDDSMARASLDAGVRTTLFIPLRREGKLLGYIGASPPDVRPFTQKEITLLESFAAQAVIAMENARLLGELRERTSDLARSVDELTATGDVLKIISRSSVELKTVLDTLVETAARICRADQAYMFRRHADGLHHMIAVHGASEEGKAYVRDHPFAPDRGTTTGRVALERRPIQIPDVLADPDYTYTEGQQAAGFRTILGLPLLREDTLIGVFAVCRNRVAPFTDKEIELATSFADQAVIAIENARLFEELRDRQAELRVTFDNIGDGVVMFGADTHLVAWNRNFQTILDLPDAFLAQRPSYADYFRYLVDRGEYSADLEAQLSRANEDPRQELRLERTRPDGRVIEGRRNPVPGGGFVLIYADITERKRAEQTIRAARDAAETALRELQAAQASLVHAQKMAALGQLTAGIAHEIKNPLNFVNNFAGLSVELLDELKEAATEVVGTLDAGKRTEILEIIRMLTGNLERIAEHGRRADGIVRGMLQHSRGSSGDWQAADLNALVEESLNLAYHGARAQDQDFNVTWELHLDRNLAPIEVVSQDVSRVLLNLISNGFYAVTRRGCEGDDTFRPLLKLATREFGEGVEIQVWDNGVGILPEHREKLFQPFFTTKPTGEGTGLGLSISYEIITQQHGGTITVDSEVGDFTEFTVRLPRRRHGVA